MSVDARPDTVPAPRNGGGLLVRTRRALSPYAGSEAVLLGLGGVIGVLTGVLAFALIQVMRGAQSIAFGADPSRLRVVLAPTLGAFVVGILATYWAREPSGGGIVQVMRTNALRAGRFRGRVPFAVLSESGIALGSGGSGGREAPIVLGGGAVGSLVGSLFAVDDDRMRTLVAAGAAAGIGASFNAPIGGMLFAIELILRRLHARSLQVVVLAAVTASVTARELVGRDIVFSPSEVYSLGDARELIGYALLGLLAVLVGLAFLHGEHLGERLFKRIDIWPPLRFALGGLAVGLIALAIPEVLGTGDHLPAIAGNREPIHTMVEGGFGTGLAGVRVLLMLLVAKLIASLLSATSGNAVGTLMPTLFTGAALGGAIGHLGEVVLPNAGVQPGAFALVGMAAVFAAAARAPLTAILLVFELTGDYGLVLPLMLAAGLATFLADRFSPDGIYTAPLRRERIAAVEPEDIDVMQAVTVGEVMTVDAPTLPASMPLAEVRTTFRRTRHHGFAVVDGERLVGVLTLSDIDRLPEDAPDDLVAGDFATSEPLTVTPGDPVFRALHRMAAYEVGRLPVVDPHDPGRLLGMLRRSDVVLAYQHAVNRGVGEQDRRHRAQLRDLTGAHFREYVVAPDAPAARLEVREVDWPPRTILTSIRRRGEVLLPHGGTRLEPGDEIVALTTPEEEHEIGRILSEGRVGS